VFTPNGKYLYEITASESYEYSVDAASGALTALPGSPVQLGFQGNWEPGPATADPSGKVLYVTNVTQGTGLGGPLMA
jgi:DNA-binding beta-propeller fold protein YncE